jgi:hypothetical protein
MFEGHFQVGANRRRFRSGECQAVRADRFNPKMIRLSITEAAIIDESSQVIAFSILSAEAMSDSPFDAFLCRQTDADPPDQFPHHTDDIHFCNSLIYLSELSDLSCRSGVGRRQLRSH